MLCVLVCAYFRAGKMVLKKSYNVRASLIVDLYVCDVFLLLNKHDHINKIQKIYYIKDIPLCYPSPPIPPPTTKVSVFLNRKIILQVKKLLQIYFNATTKNHRLKIIFTTTSTTTAACKKVQRYDKNINLRSHFIYLRRRCYLNQFSYFFFLKWLKGTSTTSHHTSVFCVLS